MTKKLRISADVALPIDFVTSTQAILAKKGSGKSYTASVQAEELLDADQQIVVVDPTGAWWGLRSSSDGKAAGYPIVVIGGEHGDLPLEPTAAEVLASAIATDHFSAVLDVSLLRKGQANRFVGDFLETLYRKNRAPLHLVLDEADLFAPQKPFGDEARTLGACEDIVRRGRIRGIGCTLITQRPQVLAKNVLSQVDMLTALRMNHPKDIGAIKEWVAVHGDEDQAEKMIASLPSLPIGEAWFWNPAVDLFQRARVRRRTTFDSGRTPKAGEVKVTPKVLAAVDLERLGATIASTVERAKADDPKALRARVAELEKQLKSMPSKIDVRVDTKVVERPALKEADVKRLEGVIEKTKAFLKRLDEERDKIAGAYLRVEVALGQAAEAHRAATRTMVPKPPNAGYAASDPNPVTHRSTRVAAPASSPPRPAGTVPVLEPRLLRLLAAVAWWESIGIAAPDATGVAFVAGYSPTSSGFEKARGMLRSSGLIDYPSGGTMRLTEEGRAIAPPPQRPATAGELHAAILRKLEPRHGRLLQPLLDAYPNALSMEQLAAAADYSPTSSGFEKARGTLRSLGLADYPRPGHVRAADLLFPEGGR